MRKVFLLFSPLLVLSIWTLVASWVTMWGLGTVNDVWWPTWQWWGYFVTTMPNESTQSVVNYWLMIGGAVAAVPSALMIYRIISDGDIRLGRDPESLYGDARFATSRDGKKSKLLYAFKPDPACLLLGMTNGLFGWFRRYVMLSGVEHVMLYAKTGAGKGISYVLSNCFNYGDSLVVLDIKHENEDVSAHHREFNLGQKVFSFSPLAQDGCSHCWNPLGNIHEGMEDYISKLQGRAFTIFPEVDGREKFWQNSARTAFVGIASPAVRNRLRSQVQTRSGNATQSRKRLSASSPEGTP